MDDGRPVGRPVKIAACGTMPPDPVFTNVADLVNFIFEGAKWAAHDEHLKMHALERVQRVIAAHSHLINGASHDQG